LQYKYKAQNNLQKERYNYRLSLLEQENQKNTIDLLNDAYEYRYQLKQYVVFHQKKILLNESIRQERVKAKLLDADFNPLHGLELIDEMFKVEIELNDIKQNLYLKLLKIHEKIPKSKIEDLIVPLFLPNYFDFEDETNRSVYIWTKTFEKHKVAFLSEYISYNQFDEVDLAISENDVFLKEKIELMKELNAKKIKINLMFGQNNLLDSETPTKEFEKIIKQFPLNLVNAIHLDIEPHTRENWKTNQENEKKKYLNLIKEAKIISTKNSLKLSVDLPLILDSMYVFEILKTVNSIKFMSYENIKEEYILRKINPFLKYKNQISISIRTEDFESRNLMEEFSKSILEKSKLNAINFHDINRLIELDKKTLNKNEER
jgi:hypothetical protein